jgi:hypothetical protein
MKHQLTTWLKVIQYICAVYYGTLLHVWQWIVSIKILNDCHDVSEYSFYVGHKYTICFSETMFKKTAARTIQCISRLLKCDEKREIHSHDSAKDVSKFHQIVQQSTSFSENKISTSSWGGLGLSRTEEPRSEWVNMYHTNIFQNVLPPYLQF